MCFNALSTIVCFAELWNSLFVACIWLDGIRGLQIAVWKMQAGKMPDRKCGYRKKADMENEGMEYVVWKMRVWKMRCKTKVGGLKSNRTQVQRRPFYFAKIICI